MAANTTTPTTDRHEDDDEHATVGLSHLTVVPTNFERDDR
jgi:hypothetical protein